MLGLDDLAVYRQLPWDTDGIVCDDDNECYIPGADGAAPVAVGHSVTADHSIKSGNPETAKSAQTTGHPQKPEQGTN